MKSLYFVKFSYIIDSIELKEITFIERLDEVQLMTLKSICILIAKEKVGKSYLGFNMIEMVNKLT